MCVRTLEERVVDGKGAGPFIVKLDGGMMVVPGKDAFGVDVSVKSSAPVLVNASVR